MAAQGRHVPCDRSPRHGLGDAKLGLVSSGQGAQGGLQPVGGKPQSPDPRAGGSRWSQAGGDLRG